MELGLGGRGCIVTGASSGIGLAAARGLCAEGARVLLVARRADPLADAVALCAQARGTADGLALDVTRPDAGERAVEGAMERFGRLDVLVNNAGTSSVRPLAELTDADWQQQWELNVMASLRLMRSAVPLMAARGFGRVVNVTSSSGKRPSQTNPAYSVTKAAQLSLSRVWADAHARDGVLVNAVAPGPVETPLWMAEGGLADQSARAAGVSRDEVLKGARDRVPLGRYGTVEEIAAVIVFLCSEAAGNVTGAAWSVDGGTVPIIL